VLGDGTLSVSDDIKILEKPNRTLSIRAFMQVVKGKITDKSFIEDAANARVLDPQWHVRLLESCEKPNRKQKHRQSQAGGGVFHALK
jgi:MOSC domain-containing protein YiiM